MPTYSVRCRHDACRHRRVVGTHPDEYKVVPKCPACGNRKGWRIEGREYNRRGLCRCSGVDMVRGVHFPHRTTHPFCDQHPRGYYNQARARGVAHEDIPAEYGGGLTEELNMHDQMTRWDHFAAAPMADAQSELEKAEERIDELEDELSVTRFDKEELEAECKHLRERVEELEAASA